MEPSGKIPLSQRLRREAAQTDESVISMTPSLRDDANLSLLLEKKLSLEDASSKTILQRALSTMTQVTTDSAFALRQQEAAYDNKLQVFEEIGRGGCGAVFEEVGTSLVVKKALQTDGKALWHDFKMHKQITEEFSNLTHLDLSVRVPRCMGFRGPEPESWWLENLSRFPKVDRKTGRHLLYSERILALPQIVREALIDEFCPPAAKESAIKSPGNTLCLVRPYLGARRSQAARHSKFFSLKNFKLHLDQMEDLGLPIEMFARAMADALAVLHYRVKVDAYDIEFVLGSAPLDNAVHAESPSSATLAKLPSGTSTFGDNPGKDFTKRIIHLWMIDFNQCKAITMTFKGMEMAVEAFISNNAYFPRPKDEGDRDSALWNVFEKQYVMTGMALADEVAKSQMVPDHFIKMLKAKYNSRGSAATV